MSPLKLDRKRFWQLYHKAFDVYGPTTQATVDALNADLNKFETETRIHGIAQYSYVLATEYHETGINGNHFVPVKEGRNRAGSKGRANQDRYWLSGFYGRGKVQTTWEDKYRAIGKLLGVGDMFVKNPDLLLENEWAYEAMVAGMSHGIYRKDGRGQFTLDRMLHGDSATVHQYEEAREIINGDKGKNGLLIAGYAMKFEHILIVSQISAAATSQDSDTAGTGSVSADTPAPPVGGDDPAGNSQPPMSQGTVQQTTFQTDEGESGASQTITQSTNVAIGKEVQVGFLTKIKLKLAGWFAYAGGLAGINEYKHQLDDLGLPGWIIIYVILGSVVAFVLWLLYEAAAHLLEWWGQRKRTDVLAQVNSTPTNTVTIVPESELDKYAKAGWVVIRRGTGDVPATTATA
jgi:hypothetical protein